MWTYRFVSQGVSVGSKQDGLRSQEGRRHAISGGHRLFLQLALERGHLVEYMQQECEAERSRQTGGGGEGWVKVKLSPLKLVEETASPFWV